MRTRAKPQNPKSKHRYLITEERLGYVWSCSCGEYDFVPRTYELARAGVKRHRRMVAAKGEGPALRKKEKDDE